MAQPWVPQTLPFFSCRIFNLAFFLSPGSRENWRDRWVTEVFVLTDGGTVVLLGREVNMWKCLAMKLKLGLILSWFFWICVSYVTLCLAQEISAENHMNHATQKDKKITQKSPSYPSLVLFRGLVCRLSFRTGSFGQEIHHSIAVELQHGTHDFVLKSIWAPAAVEEGFDQKFLGSKETRRQWFPTLGLDVGPPLV